MRPSRPGRRGRRSRAWRGRGARVAGRLDPLSGELFPAEPARVVHLLVERVEVGLDGVALRLRIEGLARLIDDLRSADGEMPSAA